MALRILLLLSAFSTVFSDVEIKDHAPDWNKFEDSEDRPLLLVEVYFPVDEVFVAGGNVLYHLTKDLQVIKKVILGPQLVCDAPGKTCEHPVNKHYIPYSMTIVHHLSMLLICSGLYNGACELRPLKDLESSIWIGPHGEEVSRCNSHIYDPAFYVPAVPRSNHYVFFCGADTSGMESRTTIRPFLSKKELVRENGEYQFKYSLDNATHISAAYFEGFGQFLLASFAKTNYSYFFFLRVNPDKSNPSFILSRLSNEKSSFSYRETPIQCDHRPHEYILGTYATLGPDNMLYILYTNSTNIAVCRYDMDLVDKHLSDDAYTSKEEHGACKGNTDFCRSSRNPVHGRGQILVSSPQWKLEGIRLNSKVFRVLKQNGQVVAFIDVVAPSTHLVLKVNLLKKSIDYLAVIDKLSLSLSTSFDIKEENLYFLQNKTLHQFPIGLCSLFKTCKKCLHSTENDPLNCGWCENRCDLQTNCPSGTFSKRTCPPNLFTFTPNHGPSWGNTLLTISGENFGIKNGSYTINTVLVAGIDCTVLSWDNNRIVCETGLSLKAATGPIVVTVLDTTQNLDFAYRGTIASQSNFTYIKPKIFGIYPGQGFSRGGTNVTLYGENLDIGDDYLVNIYKKECVNTIVQSNVITCTTTGLEKKSLPNAIQIVINGHKFGIQGPPPSNISHAVVDFNYVPFPVIEKVYPSKLFASAGHNVTVTGLFLDSAVKAEMLLSFPTSEIFNHQPCWLDTGSKGTAMKCLTPDLRNNKQVVASRAYLKFRMDGAIVTSAESIFFFPGPQYEPFEEIRSIPNYEKTLKLKGNFPNEEAVKESVKIQIGDRWLCSIIQVTDDWLHCTFPVEILTDSSHWDNILTVQAFTDSSPQFIGSIIIKETTSLEEKTEKETKLPVFVIVLILLGVIVIVGILVGVWRWKTSSCVGICSKTTVFPNVGFQNEQHNGTQCNTQSTNPLDSGHPRPTTFSKNPPPRFAQLSNSILNEPIHDYLSMDKGARAATALESEPLLSGVSGVDEETIRTLQNEKLILDPRRLVLGKKLGEGEYGEVFKAKYICPRRGKLDVAVKTTIWDPENYDNNSKFILEGVKMKDFHHKNVIELIGICFEGGMPKLIIPFMENGDLRQYLQKDITLRYSDLLKFSAQIASGMAYLAKERFVHRDLAARNCVLDSYLNVKVADFGLTRDIYEKGYYKNETSRKLPLRWMSPESLELGEFSTKSDVWSYGIVLWEIMTRGRTPYDSKENFLESIKKGYRLPKPEHCSKKMYEVMKSCWKIKPSDRPDFDYISKYIEHIINPTSNIKYENI